MCVLGQPDCLQRISVSLYLVDYLPWHGNNVAKCFMVVKCPVEANPVAVLTLTWIEAAIAAVIVDSQANAVLRRTHSSKYERKFIPEKCVCHMSAESAAQQGIAATTRKNLFLLPVPRSTFKSTTVLTIQNCQGIHFAAEQNAQCWKHTRVEVHFVCVVEKGICSHSKGV